MPGPNRGKRQMKCRDCGAVRYVTMKDLTHAARPRCLACGGPVELSFPGRDQLDDCRTAADEQRNQLRKKMGY